MPRRVHRWLRAPLAAAGALAAALACDGARETAAPAAPASGAFAPGPPRSIVLVSVDTLRPDHLGAYGYERATSPTIDRVASEGAVFANAVATSPWTLPSNASLLTGLYPHRHGLKNWQHRLIDELPTLPGVLARAGLETFGIVSSHHLTARTGLDRGFEEFAYVSEWSSEDPATRVLHNPGAEITERALAWLRTRGDAPFFLFLHYYDAHSDYAPEPAYRALFERPYAGDVDGSTAQLLDARLGKRALSPEDGRHLVDLYDAEIRQLDAQLARIVGYLDESGLASTTLLVLTADHGEEFLEHGSVLHGRTYYDEVIAVPLILRGPGVPQGTRVEALTSLIDVAPTLLGLLGEEIPEWMQGVDLSTPWRGEAEQQPTHPFVIAEADWMNERPESFHMLRTKTHKLVYDRGTGRTELYDLRSDPLERSDLSASQPELAKRLKRQLNEYMLTESTPEKRIEVSDETLDALRRLGYAK